MLKHTFFPRTQPSLILLTMQKNLRPVIWTLQILIIALIIFVIKFNLVKINRKNTMIENVNFFRISKSNNSHQKSIINLFGYFFKWFMDVEIHSTSTCWRIVMFSKEFGYQTKSYPCAFYEFWKRFSWVSKFKKKIVLNFSEIYLPWIGNVTEQFLDNCINEQLFKTLNLSAMIPSSLLHFFFEKRFFELIFQKKTKTFRQRPCCVHKINFFTVIFITTYEMKVLQMDR